MAPFQDRREAGRRLATALEDEADRGAIVLGLARGGVPVAYEVAKRLKSALDVLVVRKLGVPGHEELAMGAIAPGARVLNDDVILGLGISPATVDAVTADEQRAAESRERAYRFGRPRADVRERRVILVDDGLATGASMRVAVASLRAAGAAHITAAVPIGSPRSCMDIEQDADRTVCLTTPVEFSAVGDGYAEFATTSDDEVRELLGAPVSERTR